MTDAPNRTAIPRLTDEQAADCYGLPPGGRIHTGVDDKPNQTAARLIAEMMEADGWAPRRDLSDHPILGPINARRHARYMELRSRDFTSARITADTEAVQEIINACR